MHPHVAQVSISNGGVPNLPVAEGVVTELGIIGDAHNDSEHHGGIERALCLFAVERIGAMAAEGHPIAAGSTGENITTRGLDWDLVVPGVRLRIGPVLVEVTRYTTPCKTNERWFLGGDFSRMHHNLHPGWSRVYARVLEPGAIRPGDAIEVIPAQASARG